MDRTVSVSSPATAKDEELAAYLDALRTINGGAPIIKIDPYAPKPKRKRPRYTNPNTRRTVK